MVTNTQYLWLTMWFHTKKSKKTLKNQSRWFRYINSAPKLRNHQKSLKNRSLNRDLLNFLYRCGIFWMVPGESLCPGSSEYVWQRGVDCVLGRATSGRSLLYFKKKMANIAVSHINRIPTILEIELANLKSLLPIDYGQAQFRKLEECDLFVTSLIFATGPHLVTLTPLRAAKTGSTKCFTPLSYRFSESWMRKYSVGTSLERYRQVLLLRLQLSSSISTREQGRLFGVLESLWGHIELLHPLAYEWLG